MVVGVLITVKCPLLEWNPIMVLRQETDATRFPSPGHCTLCIKGKATCNLIVEDFLRERGGPVRNHSMSLFLQKNAFGAVCVLAMVEVCLWRVRVVTMTKSPEQQSTAESVVSLRVIAVQGALRPTLRE